MKFVETDLKVLNNIDPKDRSKYLEFINDILSVYIKYYKKNDDHTIIGITDMPDDIFSIHDDGIRIGIVDVFTNDYIVGEFRFYYQRPTDEIIRIGN